MLTLPDTMTSLSYSHIHKLKTFSSIRFLRSLSHWSHHLSPGGSPLLSHISYGLLLPLFFKLLICFVQTNSAWSFSLCSCIVFPPNPFSSYSVLCLFYLIPMSFHHTIPGSFTTGPSKGWTVPPYPHVKAVDSTVMPSGVGDFER